MSDATITLRAFSGARVPLPGVYTFDPEHTFAEFVAQHVVVGHVRGRFDRTTGTVTIAEDPVLSSVDVSVDTTTISTHNATRDADLRSPRFFHVDQFPTLTYRSTSVVAELDGCWTVEGDLTIRDITLSVPLSLRFTGIIDDQWGNVRVGAHVRAQVSRRDFGLLADLDRESGGMQFGKDVALIVDAEMLQRK